MKKRKRRRTFIRSFFSFFPSSSFRRVSSFSLLYAIASELAIPPGKKQKPSSSNIQRKNTVLVPQTSVSQQLIITKISEVFSHTIALKNNVRAARKAIISCATGSTSARVRRDRISGMTGSFSSAKPRAAEAKSICESRKMKRHSCSLYARTHDTKAS